jgi:hypothetical protein
MAAPCTVDKAAIINYYNNKAPFSFLPFVGDAIGDAAMPNPPKDNQDALSNVLANIQNSQTQLDQILATNESNIVRDISNTLLLLNGTDDSPGYIQVSEQNILEPFSEKVTLLSIQLIALCIVVLAIIFVGI